ncbi:trypco2 family protein [Streptomyces sp. NPDC006733]|uniref:trypco2 family protein n=1 Tax=Streptomyces sp. NPDC006733 TaxID=3155460 RepID=UPI0033C0BCAE
MAADEYLNDIELADAVEAVREGLATAAARGSGKNVRFEVGDIHMEFSVEIRRDVTGKAGVKAWVVDAGAETTRSRGRTHTVSFTLKPKNAATGGHLDVHMDDEGSSSHFTDAGT